MKIFNKLLVSINLISLFIASIIFITFKISFHLPIYENFYKNNPSLIKNVSTEQLTVYTQNLFAYLENKTSLDATWYSEKDILHMVDVKNLLITFTNIMYLCFIIFLISYFLIVLIHRKNSLKLITNNFNTILLIFFLSILSLGMYIAINFNSFWIKFHKILFTNDLWLLSEDESNLIKMFPEAFFFELVSKITISILICFLILFILNRLLKKRITRQKR